MTIIFLPEDCFAVIADVLSDVALPLFYRPIALKRNSTSYMYVLLFKFISNRTVCTAKRVCGSRRNEQLPFKVLFISKKKDGSYYKKSSLLSIRAALDHQLCSPPFNKKVSVCDTVQFNEANKVLNSYLKHLASSGKIAATVHRNPLTAETVQKVFEAGELRYSKSILTTP